MLWASTAITRVKHSTIPSEPISPVVVRVECISVIGPSLGHPDDYRLRVVPIILLDSVDIPRVIVGRLVWIVSEPVRRSIGRVTIGVDVVLPNTILGITTDTHGTWIPAELRNLRAYGSIIDTILPSCIQPVPCIVSYAPAKRAIFVVRRGIQVIANTLLVAVDGVSALERSKH